jgi:Common central domain of tyrosinase/Polyphenol oxidase middle domain
MLFDGRSMRRPAAYTLKTVWQDVPMNDDPHGNSTLFAPSRRMFVGGTTAVAGAAALGLAAPSVFGQTPRTRMDIVTFAQDATRLANFEAAVQEMKDRSAADETDPKGWLIVANTHRDFCPNPRNASNQMHYCYWFIAWHRAFISVTERKIRAISGDDSFSYPYWNWSTDRNIPQAFARAGSSLSNAVRYTPPRGLQDDEVDYNPDDPTLAALGVAALSARRFEATTPGRISRSFGGIARPNAFGAYGNNRLEGTPHGPVHLYVGGVSDGGDTGDMTDFATAGRDPIFFAHHGNLDRLWEIWRQDPARKATEPTSDAFLNHRFVFTWIDGAPIEVPMSDILDTTKLGYVYDSLNVFRTAPALGPMASAETGESASGRPPAVGQQTLRVPLQPGIAPDENERKILEITDVEAPMQPMTVSVFVKPASAPADQLGTSIGTFSALRAGGEIAWPSRTLTFDITAAAKKYAGEQITIQLVPQTVRPQGVAPETYPALKFGQMRIVSEGASDHHR